MAEGWTRTQNVLCRYFMHGACQQGTNCHFSHDRQNTNPSSICRFYLKGMCTYGENCRYDHIRKERLESSKPKPQNAINQSPTSSTSGPILSNCISKESKKEKLNFTTLSHPTKRKSTAVSKLCVDAPEFVPRTIPKEVNEGMSEISYAQVVGDASCKDKTAQRTITDAYSELCPYYLVSGICQLENCTAVHGLICDMCQLACLHPEDEHQRNNHIEECTKLMEAEMEHSFAVARSKEKVCGICMDTVMERSLPSERRFGILPNCSHCFCLDCLRKWRQSKQFENKIVRSCPECRVQSDYVIPSRYWVDDKDKDEKEKLMSSYREALSEMPCKYFKKGEGQCPFGNKCFYLHALPDGTKKDVGPPKRKHRYNAKGDIEFNIHNMVIWDFIEEREHRLEILRGSIQTLFLELELDNLAEDFYFPDDSFSDTSDI